MFTFTFITNRPDKIHTCALSFFRPRTRNDKYLLYYNSLLIYLDQFPRIFHTNWKLRIYYDDSLFNRQYPREATLSVNIFERMKTLDFVELVKCHWSEFLEDDNIHHLGLIGTMFRFHAITTCPNGLSIIRDIDGNVLDVDYKILMNWFNDKDTLQFYWGKEYKSMRSNCEKCIPAGMVAFKNVDSALGNQFWRQFVSKLSVAEKSTIGEYGYDELFLNDLSNIFQITINQAYDFYASTEHNAANLYYLYRDNPGDFAELFSEMTGGVPFLEEYIPPEDDASRPEGTTNYGFVQSVMTKFIENRIGTHVLLWDHMLGDLHPILYFNTVRINQRIYRDILTVNSDIETLALGDLDPFEWVVILEDGSPCNAINILKYKDVTDLSVRVIPRNQCRVCSSVAAFMCPDDGLVYCGEECAQKKK